MKVNYSDESPIINPVSIFLAGPTPRKKTVPSWRPHALEILDKLEFNGVVYVPEKKIQNEEYDYLTQVEWEHTCLEVSGAICFWVPRKLPDMPAFTTNVEFGRYVSSGRAFYGRPDDAEKKGYLDWLYVKTTGRQPFNDLEELLLEMANYLE